MATGYATPTRLFGPASTEAFSTPIASPSIALRSEPSTPFSPLVAPDPIDAEMERQKVEAEAKRFTEARDTLVGAIGTSSSLLDDLKKFATDAWTVRYPAGAPTAVAAPITGPQRASSLPTHVSGTASPSAPNGAPLPVDMRRTASEHPDSSSTEPTERPIPVRAFSTATSGYISQNDGLTVLSIDAIASGGKGRMLQQSANLAAALNRETLASLLLSHVGSVKSHLGDLHGRLSDGSSRILITGDLNAGKSTFVNALLGREVAPVDQQPCTEVMCEISDANAGGNADGKEEIHAVKKGQAYDREDPSTYTVYPLEKLSELVTVAVESDDDEAGEQQSPFDLLKVRSVRPRTRACADSALQVYVTGGNALTADETRAVSLLRNGSDISVSFIDAPGLNRDTVSTTSLFAKQSTIDVVVFVVSAENQFTLSAQEFLWAASQEKAYVFVVVNKWDAISNKSRAEKRVREQIKKLSPRTWEGRKELVHFVDSRSAAADERPEDHDISFDHLERSLSSFVLSKRFVSKLQPAQTYLCNLLHDLSVIADVNLAAAGEQDTEATARLEAVLPECRRLASAKTVLEQGIDAIEESTVDHVSASARSRLSKALQTISEGKTREPVAYPGIASVWQYALDVQAALARTVELEVRNAEDQARGETVVGVKKIREDLGRKALPDDASHTERVFNPEVMFARRRKATLPPQHVASSVGLGLTPTTAGDVHFMDLFDLERFADFAHRLVKPAGEENTGALSLVGGVGVGSLALLGTGAASGKAFVDSIVRICEMVGSKGARKWATTVVAVMSEPSFLKLGDPF